MSFEFAGRDVLDSLQPDAVQAYLRARGWQDIGTEGPSARVYGKPMIGAGSEILVPTKPTNRDYRQLAGIMVQRIAQIEEMSPEAVIQDLSFAGYDVLRICVVGAGDGSLDLEKVVVVVKEARTALVAAAAATAARAPRKNYAGRQHESVSAYVDRVRVGQTEKGSFVVPLLSPYAFDPGENETLPGEWFARRVFKKLVAGLEAIDRVLGASNGATIDGFLEATQRGVSANLTGALGRLVDGVGDIELGVRWASAMPEAPSERIRLAQASASTLLRASARLTEADPPPAEQLYGWITQLDDAGPGEQSTATAAVVIEDKLRNVRCYFDNRFREEFTAAWHERRPLLLEGKLMRDGKRLVMPNANPMPLPAEDAEGDDSIG